MTNAPKIAAKLMRHCSRDHAHMPLKGGNRTKQAEVYPEELCRSIIRGLRQQMHEDGRIMDGCIGSVCAIEPDWSPDDEQEMEAQFWDDISGKTLIPEKVTQARAEELQEFQKNTRCTSKCPSANAGQLQARNPSE